MKKILEAIKKIKVKTRCWEIRNRKARDIKTRDLNYRKKYWTLNLSQHNQRIIQCLGTETKFLEDQYKKNEE